MEVGAMREVIEAVKFGEYIFRVRTSHGATHLQATYLDADIRTGKLDQQWTRKWLLTPGMTKSEIVQTAFKCCITSMEHRTREGFTYKGRRIFGPHFDVDALVEICEQGRHDYRKAQ